MKKRRLIIGSILILFIAIAVIILSGDQGVFTLYRNYRHMQSVEQELEQSRQTIDSLTAEIKKLESDTGYIEKIAREKLGMARKNEKMYKFIEEK
jgi:cell division protein FtsB